jgi:hypothetical protein
VNRVDRQGSRLGAVVCALNTIGGTEAGVHRKELPQRVEELRAWGVPGELRAGGVSMEHLLVSSE